MKGKHIHGDIMTQERYAETQKDPRRIEGTARGKAAVQEFIEALHLREAGEHPTSDCPETKLKWIAHIMHAFAKYAISAEIDEAMGEENSLVCVYARAPDGEELFWHNLVGTKKRTLEGVSWALSRMSEKAAFEAIDE